MGILAWTLVLSARAEPVPEGGAVLDLQTAQRIAMRENPSLRTAEARIRQAEARVAQVRATFLPTLGVGASASHFQLSDRAVREIEDVRDDFDFEEDLEQRLDEVVADGADTLGRAGQRALATVRADQLYRLRGYPDLVRLQQAIFAETDRRATRYADTLRSELSTFDPVGDTIEALGIDSRPEVDDTRELYSVGAYGSWLLFDGMSRRFSLAVARYGRAGSEEAERDARRLLLGAVARAYYQAQLAREDTRIAEADVSFNARLLDEARRRREAGQTSLSTELNFEVRRNAAETARFQALRRYESSRVALAALLGFPDAELPADLTLAPLREERPEQLQSPDAEGQIAYALAYRPDVEFNRAVLEQSNTGILLARSAYSPSLNLTGGYVGTRDAGFSFEDEDFGGQVGVVLKMDLFEGGLRMARVREATALREEARSALAQAELRAVSDVRAAIVMLRFAGELLILQRRNLAISEQNRDLVEVEYQADHASLVRLNEAQRDLILAQGRYATALASLHVAWEDLREATSQSLDDFER
jgi:outer membrane protein TolC